MDLVKDLGYAGIAWHEQAPAQARAAALEAEARGLTMFTIYCAAQVTPAGELTCSPEMPALMESLKDHHTMIRLQPTMAKWRELSSTGTMGTPIPLFDGKTFRGWEGDTNRTWRIQNGEIVGGSLEADVPRNEFLCTTRPFTNFILRLKFKLTGKSGFINAGVQFRSQRVKDPPNEMAGYQADIGDPDYWGSIYDEGIRNRTLAKADMAALNRVLKRSDWNEYVIRAEGRRIRLWINGLQTVDYTEPEERRPQWGVIGLQIHGGAVAEARYKDLTLEELPGAAEPR